MSADTTEQQTAGGDDLRARYLPVSRKELRRRREAELASQREAQEEAEATADELAAGGDAASGEDPADNAVQDTEVPAADSTDPAVEEPLSEADSELNRTLEAAAAVEAEAPAAAESLEDTGSVEDDDVDELLLAEEVDDEDDEDDLEDNEASARAISLPEPPEAALPAPVEQDEPARPEEDIADAFDKDLPEEEVPDDELAADASEDEQPVEVDELESEDPAGEDELETPGELGTEDDADEQSETAEQDPAAEEFYDDQDAPIPASRRARRLLRETESIPEMSPDLLEELDHVTGEISRMPQDPHAVDPELLKRQQALAAKAMQANQERLRKEREEAERQERRRRRRERPESEIITGRTVRDSLDTGDEDYIDLATGSIEPVKAQGAHGLDLDQMVDEASRQADRQNMMQWLVIVLAALLLVAIVVLIIVFVP